MLALTRKKGESLVINNNIEITVLEIRGDQVKIGISAPKEVPVYRKEVYLQIQNENQGGIERNRCNGGVEESFLMRLIKAIVSPYKT